MVWAQVAEPGETKEDVEDHGDVVERAHVSEEELGAQVAGVLLEERPVDQD